MSHYLPYSGFKLLNAEETSDFCLNSISKNTFIRYILEVDLVYPRDCMTCIMTIDQLQKNLKLIKLCCQNIALILQINMR